ncbi:glycoside hydrolase family 15 protein [Acidiphilium acidophilum]|uniref:Trehalase n=1 Tax=Acidiphilium acidophilum TaxID=76588 RepID=A0AAW9DUG5_ACIAO|nr:glycoside hydrolase family 15 protein [Acidiphilium acidophilum]MDX5931957.1 glycoside hydrolase family 15 protein [Acidiphilium acidophilum]GBQ05559.1 glycoside hydrolase 15-like protein [Acidiphilium acidophilum DSM 700]
MALRIEDYGLIGDRQTTALVGKDGSIDFLCLPRFDSDPCFAALLGTSDNGRWLIAPEGEIIKTHRYYREDTLVLETEMTTATGTIRLTDCMVPHPHDTTRLVRQVTGLDGNVDMKTELVFRFGFGKIVPWVQRLPDGKGITAVAGPDMVVIWSEVELEGRDHHTAGEFSVAAGETVTFGLEWLQSHRRVPHEFDVKASIATATEKWQSWARRVPVEGRWVEIVKRSLITLKALTHWETGGIVAAATTSLPEELGGERNWDYRYCWLRDASFTLQAFLAAGYREEAKAWRLWLDRAVAGNPDDIQIMYGIAGERRLAEWTVDWLAGYENSRPVRVGNAAAEQRQLDVYGELLDTLYQGHKGGLKHDENSWQVRCNLLGNLETIWAEPDEGIWEVRGGRQQFVHSKVMAWVAFDRAIRSIEEFGYEGPVECWRGIRQQIHDQVCAHGFDTSMNSFVQAYGSTLLDASLLLLTMVGFLPPDDPRMIGTVAAIERDLLQDGFVRRYNTSGGNDGLSGTEGVFLACSFWLVDNYTLMGRKDDAEELFGRLIALRNDLGLFSEEYDTKNKRQIGNFPQAFTHVALVNAALRMHAAEHGKPAPL